ncbi:hypothetical protein PHLCEN_2v12429 [Hermanssonia centrifuga]|uniref:Uncharacterized protein n=1 Tax=Hermanssonia centrifuga TaxID=98765 RepID=A0A2R6NH42_9APHY|nr:hypothetical protein PHLCEN_2v12429 [Hermanssonia centrifuga]
MASARFLATLHAVRKAISPEQDFFVQFKENIIYHAPTGKFGVVCLSSNIDEVFNKLKDAFGTGSTPNGSSLLILAEVLSDSLTRFISDTFSTDCDLISPPLLLALVEGLLLQSGLIRLMAGLTAVLVLFTNPLDSEDYITEPKEYALAATRLCESNLKQEHLKAENRHMFVVMANMAFLPNRLVLPEDESSKMERLCDLLQSMTTVFQTALDRGWTNCGTHMDLPWVDALVKGIKESSQQPSPLVSLIPSVLLDNIGGKGIQQGLISGKHVQMQYNELLKICQ